MWIIKFKKKGGGGLRKSGSLFAIFTLSNSSSKYNVNYFFYKSLLLLIYRISMQITSCLHVKEIYMHAISNDATLSWSKIEDYQELILYNVDESL